MKKQSNKKRNRKGFSLISTFLFTSFSIGLMLTVLPLTFNVLRREGVSKTLAELQIAAELGIDYGTKEANRLAVSPLGAPGPTWSSSVIPTAEMPPELNATVKTQMLPVTDSTLAGFCSSFYTQNLSQNNWRILDSTASHSGFSKSIRVLLEPRYEITNDIPRSPSQAFFDSSLSQKNPADLLFSDDLSIITDPTTKLKGFKQRDPNSTGAATFNSQPISSQNFDPDAAILPDAPKPTESQLLPGYKGAETLAPGSYQAADIPSDFHATVDLKPSQAPVKLYITDYLGSSNPIVINSSSITYANANAASNGNMQIFYNGTRDITLNISADSDFHGLIYAPNSNVSITTNGASAFFGALASTNVKFSNTDPLTLNIDSTFSNSSKLQQLGFQGTGLTYTGTSAQPDLQGYRVAGWTEYSGQLVP